MKSRLFRTNINITHPLFYALGAVFIFICAVTPIYHAEMKFLQIIYTNYLNTVTKQISDQISSQIQVNHPTKSPFSILAQIQSKNPDLRSLCLMQQSTSEKLYKVVAEVGQMEEEHPSFFSGYSPREILCQDREHLVKTKFSAIIPIRGQSENLCLGVNLYAPIFSENAKRLRNAYIWGLIVILCLSQIIALVTSYFHSIKAKSQDSDTKQKGSVDSEMMNEYQDQASTPQISDLLGFDQSTQDILTGTYNSLYFQQRLVLELDQCNRSRNALCVLVMNLDHFKLINDTYGRAVGDSVLEQVGDILKNFLRKTDIVSRYGGDEFAIILPQTNLAEGINIAERIRIKMAKNEFGVLYGDGNDTQIKLRQTVTIGLACYPKHGGNFQDLIDFANRALYRKKITERNCVGVYKEELDGKDQQQIDVFQILHDPNVIAAQTLVAAVNAKDNYTAGHSTRVAENAEKIGEVIGIAPENLRALQVAGLLHDVGKIGIPDQILGKKGSLDQNEFKAIKRHPLIGASILDRCTQLEPILPAVLYHHERWDGKGYPEGLSGKSIPLIARIMCMADSLDAMTTDRPYRKGMTLEEALAELQNNSGTQFDPNLVKSVMNSEEIFKSE